MELQFQPHEYLPIRNRGRGGIVGFYYSKFTFVWCLVIATWTVSAVSQTGSDFAQHATSMPTALSNQEFHCHTGYPLAQCQRDILQLKSVLAHYPLQGLGHWTWVLVRSQDWKPISRHLQLNPESPAFTALEPRETFLEEAMFAHGPERIAELMDEWQSSMPDLLELEIRRTHGTRALEEMIEHFPARKRGVRQGASARREGHEKEREVLHARLNILLD